MSQELINQLVAFARTSNSENSREELKKKKSKKENNSSLLGEEPEDSDFVTSCLAAANSIGVGQEAVDNMITPARTSNRGISGITAQHVKTERGIKVSISIQTPDDRAEGSFVSLTAELKRHSRLRELKRYSGDSATFEQHYIDTITSLKELTPKQGAAVCCGRLHQRGKRAAWFADMMVVGELDATSTYLERLVLYSGLEEYVIDMNQELTERQIKGYHRAGIYGEIVTVSQAPRLSTAPRRTM